ncbi:MAG: hypothetical protein M1834_003605 [Cirrosporium novae-zelandiae]|nr:MAG: hypothetical protein M1834_003605 [Cirrosporium novae-zelandiae]
MAEPGMRIEETGATTEHPSGEHGASQSFHTANSKNVSDPSIPTALVQDPIQEPPEQPHPARDRSTSLLGEQAETASSPSPPPPLLTPFNPIFTLVSTSNENEKNRPISTTRITKDYHHPDVHYIFSDDASDGVVEACLRSLGTDVEGYLGGGNTGEGVGNENGYGYGYGTSEQEQEFGVSQGGPGPHHRRPSALPALEPSIQDRYIIIDVEPDPPLQSPPVPVPPAPLSADPTNININPSGSGSGNGNSTSNNSTNPSEPIAPAQNQTGYPYRITKISSLTPTFQVLSAQIDWAPGFDQQPPTPPPPAPRQSRPGSSAAAQGPPQPLPPLTTQTQPQTQDPNNNGDDGEDAAAMGTEPRERERAAGSRLMLNIVGTEGVGWGVGSRLEREVGEGEVEELMGVFERRMGELLGVVGGGVG